MLVQPGNRLSIQPASKEAWVVIVGMGMTQLQNKVTLARLWYGQ